MAHSLVRTVTSPMRSIERKVIRPIGRFFGGGAERGASEAERASSDIARQLFSQTAQLRSTGIPLLEQAMLGGGPWFDLAFTPQRELIEGQFKNLREAILSNIPGRGGQLNDLLFQAELDRVRNLTDTARSLRESLIGQGLNVGFQVPQISLQGFGQAGNLALGRGQLGLERMDLFRKMLGDLGMAIGMGVF